MNKADWIHKDSKTNDVKETSGILNFEPIINYEKPSEFKRTEKFYTQEEINKILGKINNAIECYRFKYKSKPMFIIISKELAILFRKQCDLMSYHEMIILNNEPLEINHIFGFSCFVSPVLTGLEFEVR